MAALTTGGSSRGGVGPGYGDRIALVTSFGSLAGSGAGDFKKSKYHLLGDRQPMSRYRFI